MINLCNTLLPNYRVHAIPAENIKIIKPIPVIDGKIEVDVAPMITIVSTDSKVVFRVLKFLYFFFGLWFLFFEICGQFFIVVDMVIKTINTIQFHF